MINYFKKLRIGQRLILNIIGIILIILLPSVTLIYFFTKKAISKEIEEKLHVINDLKIERINRFFEGIEEGVTTFKKDKIFLNNLEYFVDNMHSNNDSILDKLEVDKHFFRERLEEIKDIHDFRKILLLTGSSDFLTSTSNELGITDEEKNLLFNTKPHIALKENEHADAHSLFDIGREKKVYSTYRSADNDNESLILLTPIYKANRELLAVLGVEIGLSPIRQLISDTTGLGNSGETLLTQRIDDSKIEIICSSDGSSGELQKGRTIMLGNGYAQAITRSVFKEFHGFELNIVDYKSNRVDAAWSFIPGVNWGIVTKINHDESFKSVIEILYILMIVLVIGLAIAFLFIAIFAQRFLKPIMTIRNNLLSLANGKFPDKIHYRRIDEIFDTTHALNNLVERLKVSTEFAQRIGKGDLNADYKHYRVNDVLSKALLSMRRSLIQLEEDNQKRKWATEGIALHADVLRKNSSNINDLCNALLSTLVTYLEAQHGGMYTITYEVSDDINDDDDDGEQDNVYYSLTSTYAYDVDSNMPTKFRLGQGLIGQCALERRTISLENTPLALTKISSSLGHASAGYVLIVPLRVNQEVLGVLELACFSQFEPYKIEFIEKLADSIASSILSVKSAEKTHELLIDSQVKTRELNQKAAELIENQSRVIDRNKELLVENEKLKSVNQQLLSEVYKLKKEILKK